MHHIRDHTQMCMLTIIDTAIRDAILLVDLTILTTDRLEALMNVAPTNDEISMITSYTGDIAQLGFTEQLFRTLSTIPRYYSPNTFASWF
jgi:hypothetical protein